MSPQHEATYCRSLQLIGPGETASVAADLVALQATGTLATPGLTIVRDIVISVAANPREVSERLSGMLAGHARVLILQSAAALWKLPELLCDRSVTHVGLDEGAYCADCGIVPDSDVDACSLARNRTVVEAIAAGAQPLASLPPWEFVVADLAELATIRRQCGFKGMFGRGTDWIAAANEAFVPPSAELDFARRVLSAFMQAESAGRATVEVDGHMIDIAAAHWAKRLLAWADDLDSTREPRPERGQEPND